MEQTGYYRRFIRRYVVLAAPLTYLLKKDNFSWSISAEKQAITLALVLPLPNFSQPFVLETDASGLGVDAVLSQANHPIAFFSKKLSLRMQKQSVYTREFYVVTKALNKF